jgi:hypothetical protein
MQPHKLYCITHPNVVISRDVPVPASKVADLGENDRSATGFLPPEEFERVADEFFGSPEKSARGWERAGDAQVRIVRAVEGIAQTDRTPPSRR